MNHLSSRKALHLLASHSFWNRESSMSDIIFIYFSIWMGTVICTGHPGTIWCNQRLCVRCACHSIKCSLDLRIHSCLKWVQWNCNGMRKSLIAMQRCSASFKCNVNRYAQHTHTRSHSELVSRRQSRFKTFRALFAAILHIFFFSPQFSPRSVT